MTPGSMRAAASTPPPVRPAAGPWQEARIGPPSGQAARRGEEVIRVLWDEVAPTPPVGWPGGGSLLFLWPQLPGDDRSPAWTLRPDDPEDERTTWWNREDSKVSAARLRPLYAELVAFHSERAGPVRIEPRGGIEAVREYLRRLLRTGAAPISPTRLDGLAALAEGAEGSGRTHLTFTFGTPPAAVLHARHDERCLWAWQSDRVREEFDRLLEASDGASRFTRCAMDWAMTGKGLPAPRPPGLARRR